MTNKEYLINEFGLQIARERISKQIADFVEEKNEKDFQIKMLELIKDKNEIEKENLEIIKKYIGEMDVE